MKRLADPDPIVANDQLQTLQGLLKAWGPRLFCATFFWILPKESKIIPFCWNRVQTHIFPRLAKKNRVLKARQPGFTTFFLLVRLLLAITTERGKGGLLISQNSHMATQHFIIARRALRLYGALDPYDNNQNDYCRSLRANILHTTYANRRELFFDVLDSKLIVESAEVEEAAQGITLHAVVASEVPRWPGDPEATVSNIKGALVKDGTFDEEGTANGFGGYFCEQYLKSMDNEALGDARSHFYPHWMTDEFELPFESKKEEDELLADLKSDELAIIAKMHKDLSEVCWMGNTA